ncbi:MAG: GNAT family N-acetyltransferase [Phycisphaerae bacterium]|nr:GNAT family N-acetyltransferase [Phycisphaerae bacterium]
MTARKTVLTISPMAPDAQPCPGNHLSLPRTLTFRDGRSAIIRQVVEADAGRVLEVLPQGHRETEFLAYMPGEFDWTVEQEREFIRVRAELQDGILIGAEVGGRLVALAGAERSPRRRYRHHAELGMTVLRDYWGLGIGQALMDGIVAWACDRRLRKLYLRVFADNARAHRLYVRCGFVEEGRLRDDGMRSDGTLVDTIVMARFFEFPDGRE